MTFSNRSKKISFDYMTCKSVDSIMESIADMADIVKIFGTLDKKF